MSEFTGERVTPGLVDENLMNEHLARYRFAANFVSRCEPGFKVLDAGCGSGYGTAEFGDRAVVTGVDISADAVRHANQNFAQPGVRFLQASCDALPVADASFDLVTAFEVIEHLERWPELLSEARRVLSPGGVLLVSTPNKSYYAESRAAAGPNPFHCHEFEYEDFEASLYAVFPHVRIWTQNHAETIVFAPSHPSGTECEANGDATPETAHFFVAACSNSEIEANGVYAWMPSTSNLLREREQHIAKLEGELAKKDAWLRETVDNHAKLHRSHEATLEELKQRNEWAARLNQEVTENRAYIRRLQDEAAGSLAETERERLLFRELDAEFTARTDWAKSLEEQLDVRTRHMLLQAREIEEHTEHLERQRVILDDYWRTLKRMREERSLIAGSNWMRLGRTLRLGPVVGDD